MPISGKKRARKSQEDASKKKAKHEDATAAAASGANIDSPKVNVAVATPSLVASPAARKSSAPQVSTRNVTSRTLMAQQQTDTVGNPYDDESPAVAPSVADTKKAAPPQKKAAASANKKESLATPNGMTVKTEVTVVSKRNPTSVPCILLFLVAILMWCTVALLGLLLSERMDHELHVWQLRNMLHKSEAVGIPLPPEGEELQKKLDSKKKSKLQEIGEKLVNLEYME
jgi:hypothetical protein